MQTLVAVAIGGAFGALSRYGVDQVALTYFKSSLQGTFIVNSTGSFVLGIVAGILISHGHFPDPLKFLVTVGFLGSYTTFSTLSFATVRLLQQGEIQIATVNLLGTVLAGIAAAALGLLIGRSI